MLKVFETLVAIFCVWYGWKSLVSGLKRENKSLYLNLGHDGLKDLLKNDYDNIMNIIWGGLLLLAGICVLIMNLIRLGSFLAN